jgi:hypothetical protein
LTGREGGEDLLERRLVALDPHLGKADLPQAPLSCDLEDRTPIRAVDVDLLPGFCIEESLNARIGIRGIVLDEQLDLGEGDLAAVSRTP